VGLEKGVGSLGGKGGGEAGEVRCYCTVEGGNAPVASLADVKDGRNLNYLCLKNWRVIDER
jgi:hypothetical protein